MRVLAVGSYHGDDQAAWIAARRLCCEASDMDVRLVAEPFRILDHLDCCDTAIILDACRSGSPPGTIHRLEWPDPRLDGQTSASSHGFGVVRVLELANQLGVLPRRVVLIGVEAENSSPNTPAGAFEKKGDSPPEKRGQSPFFPIALSDAVDKALPEMCLLALKEAAHE